MKNTKVRCCSDHCLLLVHSDFFHTDNSLFARKQANLLAYTNYRGRKEKKSEREREREETTANCSLCFHTARLDALSLYLNQGTYTLPHINISLTHVRTHTHYSHSRTHSLSLTSLACSGVRFRMKMSQQHFYFVRRARVGDRNEVGGGGKHTSKTHFSTECVDFPPPHINSQARTNMKERGEYDSSKRQRRKGGINRWRIKELANTIIKFLCSLLHPLLTHKWTTESEDWFDEVGKLINHYLGGSDRSEAEVYGVVERRQSQKMEDL